MTPFKLENNAQCDVCLSTAKVVRVKLYDGRIIRLCRKHAQAAITAFKSPKMVRGIE